MSSPELNPFVEANACSTCPSNQFATTTSDNDDLSCCATVAGGTCTECTSALASGCTAVSCIAGKGNVDNDATNGCEASTIPVPNGDESSDNSGTGLRKVVSDWTAGGTLKDAVVAKYGEIENWGTSEVTNLAYVFYGKSSFNADISNWVVSSVTTMHYTFCKAKAFNADISKWVVSRVTQLKGSKSCLAKC